MEKIFKLLVINPGSTSTKISLFENEEEPVTYTFDGKVPVHLSEGRCAIDFSEIRRRIPGL